MDIKEAVNKKADEANDIISRYLPKESGFQRTIMEAMNYSVSAGGKRLRPILMRQMYILYGGKSQVVEPFMAAIEMIHTYSLVHDDLPAMDNDEYRRGKKTTHAVYGEAMGVLAGDALLNFAFETAFRAFDIEPQNHDIPRALKYLANKSGIYGMVGGQVIDIEAESDDMVSKEKLDEIYRLKTGALIEASMVVGAMLAHASDPDISIIEEAAAAVGLAFQIQDDILDVTGTLETLGKPIGSDEKNAKTTYVTYEGIDKATEDVVRISEHAIAVLEGLGISDGFLSGLIRYLAGRDH